MAKYEDLIGPEDGLLAITGRAWLYQDDPTRPRTPLHDDSHRSPTAARGEGVSPLDPNVAAQIQPGDFIVAGTAFEPEEAQRDVPAALKALGVAAVIARSFGSAFLRNALTIGLPALVIEEAPAILNGDRLRVDVEAHIVANLSSGDRYVVRNLDDEAIAILRAGGMAGYRKRHGGRA